MIYYSSFFILGLLFEKNFLFGYSFGVLIILIATSLFLIFKNDKKYNEKIFCAIFFGLGIFRMALGVSEADSSLYQELNKKIFFEGVISTEPDKRDSHTRYNVSVLRNNFSKEYLEFCRSLDANKFQSNSETYLCTPEKGNKFYNSQIMLVSDRFPELNYGDKILVSGKLEEPENFKTDSGEIFDYISYLKKDDVYFIIQKPTIKKVGENKNILSSIYSIKNNFQNKIKNILPEPNSSLVNGMIFGTKESLGEKILNDFKIVGLIHIVVLSGYNLSIIATSFLYIGSYFGKRNYGFSFGVIMILLFGTMVGFSATVLRATIMTLIAILAKYLGRESQALRTLFVSGFLILLFKPILINDPSFKLSFMATFGLIIWSDKIKNLIEKSIFKKFIPEKFGMREIFSSTLAVQLFILPLLVQIGGSFSFISIVANLLATPLVASLMFLGFAIGLLHFIPLIGQFMAWIPGIGAFVFSQIIITIANFGAKISFLTINLGTISTGIIVIWYIIYAFLYLKISRLLNHQT